MIATALASRPGLLAEPVAARTRLVTSLDTEPLGTRCRSQKACVPDRFDGEHLLELDAVFGTHVKVKRREVLYRANAPFMALYAVRIGTFKTLVLAEDGREQIVGYHMGGDILGLDGIGSEQHECEAIALEDSEVCALPFAKLDELAHREPELRRTLFRLMSRNLHRARGMMMLLGTLSAEERLAVFLLDLAECFQRSGYSGSEFMLRMTRGEIASFLGLKLETVSRTFSRLHGNGVIQVQGRAVKLLDSPALNRLAGYGPPKRSRIDLNQPAARASP